MALLPAYRSAFQTARQTTALPNFTLPVAAAAPSFGAQPRVAVPAQASGTAAWTPPVPVAPAARGPSLTVNQAANRQVNQILAPQYAQQAAYAKLQNNAIQQFALALMGKLQPIAGQVGADWNQAIDQTGALADRAATFLQNANPTPQVQALLQAANAPASQQAQISGQLGQTFGGGAGVLSFLGGAVPGGEMATEKAAAQTQAEGYPALASLRGQQDLAAALAQQATARGQIGAQRGQLFATARNDILANAMKRQQLAGQRAAAVSRAAYEAASTAERRRHDIAGEVQAQINQVDKVTQQKVTALIAEGFNPATGEINPKTQVAIDRVTNQAEQAKARLAQGAQRIAISRQQAQTSATRAATAAQQGAQRIAQGAARLAVEQRRERAYERSQAFKQQAKQKGISATSYANLRKQALKQADLFYYGKAPTNTAGTNGIAGIDYGPALKQLMDGYSLAKGDAQAILNDFYAPGERGRPAAPSVTVRSKGPFGVSATATP